MNTLYHTLVMSYDTQNLPKGQFLDLPLAFSTENTEEKMKLKPRDRKVGFRNLVTTFPRHSRMTDKL